MYHILFIHSSVDGDLVCFHILAILNTLQGILEYMYFLELWFSPDICPWVGLLGHIVDLFLVFFKESLYYFLSFFFLTGNLFVIWYYTCFNASLPNHPPTLPLPQSPKDCSIHLCLFCCLAYRVVVTIFLNSIYMY